MNLRKSRPKSSEVRSLLEERVFTCEECQANKLTLDSIKEQLMSFCHKNNHKHKDSTKLNKECHEMSQKIGHNSSSYFCTPCGYSSEFVIHTKSHIQEENHKKRTMNYCHAYCSVPIKLSLQVLNCPHETLIKTRNQRSLVKPT